MGGQQSKTSKFDELEDSRDAMTKRERKRLGAGAGEPQFVPRREATREQMLANNGTAKNSRQPIQSTESSDDSNGDKTLPIQPNNSSGSE